MSVLFVDRGDKIRWLKMMRSVSVSHLGSDFDDFLFARIGEDRNKMPLSVLSALARLDLDPWEEAANLARLPAETATHRLSSLIAALPDEPSAPLDPGTISVRLIALLPSRASSNVALRETLLGVGEVTNSRAAMYMLFINVIFFAFLLAAQFVVASRQAPAQVVDAQAPAVNPVFPQIPTPSSAQ